jgi:hypothetical protein
VTIKYSKESGVYSSFAGDGDREGTEISKRD